MDYKQAYENLKEIVNQGKELKGFDVLTNYTAHADEELKAESNQPTIINGMPKGHTEGEQINA